MNGLQIRNLYISIKKWSFTPLCVTCDSTYENHCTRKRHVSPIKIQRFINLSLQSMWASRFKLLGFDIFYLDC